MFLVNNAAICVALLGNIICQVINQGKDAGQTFPLPYGRQFEFQYNISLPDARHSAIDPSETLPDEMFPAKDRSVLLPGGRLSAIKRSVSSPDDKITAIDRIEPLSDGMVSTKDRSAPLPDGKISSIKRSVSSSDGRLSGVERSVSLPDGRLSGVERSRPLPDGRLSVVKWRVATVNRINLARNDRRVAKSTYIAQGIVNGSRPFGDGRTSAIARVISNHRVCTIDIVAKFPDLKNKGSAVAALLMMGKYGQGETGVGKLINFWDGGAGINIPFYGSQVLNKLYLEARLQPTAGSQFKQVFATSCNYVDRVPTFEVNFGQFQGTGGVLTILARTDGIPGLAEISFPYNFNDEFILRVIYDGQRIGAFLDSTVSNMSNNAARSLPGLITIDRSGLRFAHCRNRDNMFSFIGHVSQIKVTKCLTREMQEALNSIPAVV